MKSGIKVGLWTSENMQHMRAVFKGPDGGTYIVNLSGTHMVVNDGDYRKMDEDDVNENLAIHEEWFASCPTK